MSANSTLLKWINILAFALTVLVNSLAGATSIIGGVNTAAISDAHPTLITPAGYVFSIWGVIYVLLGIFVIYQALPSQKGKEFHERIGWLFALSSAANVSWIFLWQFEHLILAAGMIFLLLASLILIYLRLGIGKSEVPLRERLAVHLPFSVYLGWITIASIANVSVTLVSMRWNGFGIGPEIWAALVVMVALLISVLVVVTRVDAAYALVIIWALIGIAVAHSGNQTVVMLTEIGATIVAVTLVARIIFAWLRRR
jgi:translocator protein